MAQPDISGVGNGLPPDGDILNTAFTFLLAGKGILKDTYANIVIAGTGTDPFLAWATDEKMFMLWTGDATVGRDGFLIISVQG